MSGRLVVVTGAFGYTGRYVAERLLDRGDRVRTLTGRSPTESPFGDRVEVRPYSFDDPARLVDSLRGADALVNTYWVRYQYGTARFAEAVRNSEHLFAAAREAGVRRIAHVSITNPSVDSPYRYFSGKAAVEAALRDSGLSHAVLRPAVLFGGGADILVNNIAYFLRKLPFFGVPGLGRYPIRPIHVEDLADLLVAETLEERNLTLDAVGPESFRFVDFVRKIRDEIGRWTPVVPAPATVSWVAARVFGWFVGDLVLTWEEIESMSEGVLGSEEPPSGSTLFSVWLAENAEELGRSYASEVKRHFPGRRAEAGRISPETKGA